MEGHRGICRQAADQGKDMCVNGCDEWECR